MSECIRCEFTDLMLGEYRTWERVGHNISNLRVEGVQAIDWFFDPTPENSWDGAHEQGHEGDVFMVFKYKERFFRVQGKSNSYGDLYWDGGLKEVFPTKVVKTVYEYSEKKED